MLRKCDWPKLRAKSRKLYTNNKSRDKLDRTTTLTKDKKMVLTIDNTSRLRTESPCNGLQPAFPTDILIKLLLNTLFFQKPPTQSSTESSNLTPDVPLRFPKLSSPENMFPISSRLSLLVFYSVPCCVGPDLYSLQGKQGGGGGQCT